ncbi:MAG: ROK family protein [Erysipelotrichaceae bacterium]
MKTTIGIDLGGTNVRVAMVDLEGHILQEVKGPSFGQEGPAKVMANLISLIHQLKHIEDCIGIGIGVPGPVDAITNMMTMSTNLPGFTGYPMATDLYNEFNLPAYLDNDANVAGLAEARFGAGKGHQVVYYITHSTGIGGALVIDGKVVSGRQGYAGEIGNIIVSDHGQKINHLNIGAVENLASGTALVKTAQSRIDQKISSAAALFDLAQKGNPIALEIIDKMAYDFARMCSAIAHVVDPHVFVIGGGVSKSHQFYFAKVLDNYNQLVHVGMRNPEFKLALLDEPGIIGAASLPISRRK